MYGAFNWLLVFHWVYIFRFCSDTWTLQYSATCFGLRVMYKILLNFRNWEISDVISGIERTLLNFCVSGVNWELRIKEPKHSRFKDFETRGGGFQISIPLNLLAMNWVFKKFFKTERAVLLDHHIWLKDNRRLAVLRRVCAFWRRATSRVAMKISLKLTHLHSSHSRKWSSLHKINKLSMCERCCQFELILISRARRFLFTWSWNEGLWKQPLPDVRKIGDIRSRMCRSYKYHCSCP